jgi:type III restriction enzyme
VADAVIENPILNSPFTEPTRYFRVDEDGITNEIVEGRRPSAYFVPVPSPRRRDPQLAFQFQWTADRLQLNPEVNQIRSRVDLWRRRERPAITRTTRALLDWWTTSERDHPLFFCQVEAAETAIYIVEAAHRNGDAWIANALREYGDTYSNRLPRMALKMATGSGKTVVMAMLIAWQVLNRLANPQDRRFSDTFLIVTPGLTIRDRLRVLLPSDPDNYYRKLDLASIFHVRYRGAC